MMYIKKFIDKVSSLEARPGKDLVMPAQEARMLRDEIAKLMSDRLESALNRPAQAPSDGQVVIRGGSFK